MIKTIWRNPNRKNGYIGYCSDFPIEGYIEIKVDITYDDGYFIFYKDIDEKK